MNSTTYNPINYDNAIEALSCIDFTNYSRTNPDLSAINSYGARIMLDIIIDNDSSKTSISTTPRLLFNELFGIGSQDRIWSIRSDVRFLKDVSIATNGFAIGFIIGRVFPTEFAEFIIKNQNSTICANYIDNIFYDDSNFMKNGGRLVYDKCSRLNDHTNHILSKYQDIADYTYSPLHLRHMAKEEKNKN